MQLRIPLNNQEALKAKELVAFHIQKNSTIRDSEKMIKRGKPKFPKSRIKLTARGRIVFIFYD
jgi:hypothetical protein